MTDLTTLSAEELDAQIEAMNAEKARREAEPDWDAAVAAFVDAYDRDCYGEHENSVKLGLIAAAPLIPTPEIDESQIDQIAHRCQFADGIENRTLTPYNAAQRAIRETIRLLGHAPKGGAA